MAPHRVVLVFASLIVGALSVNPLYFTPDFQIPLRMGPTPTLNQQQHASPLMLLPAGTPSPNPFYRPIENESGWLGWDTASETDREAAAGLEDAFLDIIALIPYVHEHLFPDGDDSDEDSHVNGESGPTDVFVRWFGDNDPREVWAMYTAICVYNDVLGTCKLSADAARAVNARQDWQLECQTPGVAAYTDPGSGYFHFCDRAWQGKTRIDNMDCSSLGDYIGLSAANAASTLLHELTHFETIARHAGFPQGTSTQDHCIHSWQCAALDTEHMLTSAENYALFAKEAFFADKCQKSFGDPPRNSP